MKLENDECDLALGFEKIGEPLEQVGLELLRDLILSFVEPLRLLGFDEQAQELAHRGGPCVFRRGVGVGLRRQCSFRGQFGGEFLHRQIKQYLDQALVRCKRCKQRNSGADALRNETTRR